MLIDIEKHYRAIIESSEDAIISKDIDGLILSWNPGAERLFGYSADEMIGQSIRRLLPEDRLNEEDEILARIRDGEPTGQKFTKRLHKSGTLLDISIAVSPVINEAGEVIGASKIARDIGPYVESQRRLRETESRFILLADNMPPMAWIAQTDASITWYNKRWFEYTGTTFELMQKLGWESFHSPDHIQRVQESFRAATQNGKEWEEIFPLRRNDGEWRWFLSRAMPIRSEDGEVECWFGTNTDITEQREQADQIQILLMEVNHRSKNLLSMVQALARRTLRDADIGEGGADFIKRLESRIQSLAVNQNLLVKGEWRAVPVRELAEKQLDFIKGAAGDVNLDGPDVQLTPRASEVIGMAFHELATNALKYGALSVHGGKVDIGWDITAEKVDGADMAEEQFSIWWRETGGPSVADNGRRGFGSTLIRDVPAQSFRAKVELVYHESGICWEMTCPRENVCG